jgi:hypothetical protein
LGILGDDVLPDSYVEDLASDIATAPNAEQLTSQIEATAARWGKAWPQVYGQLAKKLPDVAAVIGSGIPRAAAVALASTARLSTTEMKALLPTNVKLSDIEADVTDQLADFQRSLPADAARMVAAFQDSGTRLAVKYMNAGESSSNAAQKAVNDLVHSQYNFEEFQGAPIRIPKIDPYRRIPLDASAIVDGAENALEAYAPSTPDVDVPEFAPRVSEEYLSSWREYVIEHGYFMTAPHSEGVRLYVDGGPVTQNGRHYDITWQELEALHVGADAKRYEQQTKEAERRSSR